MAEEQEEAWKVLHDGLEKELTDKWAWSEQLVDPGTVDITFSVIIFGWLYRHI
ncbi:hypothetical protein RSAG8_05748, partial [Rhizoctonia solani AG-8 WAC10335]